MVENLKLSISAIDKASSVIKKVGQNMNKVQDSLSKRSIKLGKSLSTKLTLPIVGFGALAVRKFAGVEQGIIDVQKTTGLAFKDIKKDTFELSKALPVPIEKLLEISGAAGQLGVKGRDNIKSFTEAFAKLEVASNVAGEGGAKSIARILSVTGTAIKDVDRFSSTLVDLGNNAEASESEILGVANRVAGATARFDLGAVNVLGISTALKSLGKEAESSGSVMGKSFNAIDQAIRNGGKELTQLQEVTRMSGAELKKAFKEDATGVFKSMIDGLSRIEKSGGNTTQALSNMGLSGLRTNDILGTLIKKNDVLDKNLKRSSKAWKDNTALNAEFNAQTKTLNATFARISNAFTRLATVIGIRLKPAFEALANKLEGVISFFENNEGLSSFTLAIAGIAAAIGPLLIGFGMFMKIGGVLLKILPLLKLGFAVVGTVISALLSPIGLVVAAVAGMTLAIVAAVKHFDKIKKFTGFGKNGFFTNLFSSDKKDSSRSSVSVGAKQVKKQADNREFMTRTNNAMVTIEGKNIPDGVSLKSQSDSNDFFKFNNGMMGAF